MTILTDHREAVVGHSNRVRALHGGNRARKPLYETIFFADAPEIVPSDGPDLYGNALAAIIKIERRLVWNLVHAQKLIVAAASDPNKHLYFYYHMTTLVPVLKGILVHSAKQSWRAGAIVASIRLKRDLKRQILKFRDASEDDALIEMPQGWTDWYEASVDESLHRYTDNVRNRISQLTRQSVEAGDTTQDLQKKIQKLVEGMTGWQAERIARTETMRVWNLGHYQRLEQTPAETLTGYEYSVVLDDRTSHICQSIAGLKVARDDFELIPPLHPHCRTIVNPVYSFDEDVDFGSQDSVNPAEGFGSIPDIPTPVIPEPIAEAPAEPSAPKRVRTERAISETGLREGFHEAGEEERKQYKIPPAWTSVQFADEIDESGLIAIGRDSKGRAQYRYTAEKTTASLEAKFERGALFDQKIREVSPVIEKDALTDNPCREEAAALRLIQISGFRVGSDTETGAKVKAYGASTLKPEHVVSIEGDTMHFVFVGKKGVVQDHFVRDAELAKEIQRRMGQDRLFKTSDAKIRDYVHDTMGQFKVHDFRTWNATQTALKEVQSRPIPTTKAEYESSRKAVGEVAGKLIGDNYTVALESYVDPKVFQSWANCCGQ